MEIRQELVGSDTVGERRRRLAGRWDDYGLCVPDAHIELD